jgi:zinc protease
LADEVLSDVDLRQQAGLIEVGLVMADGARVASGEAALLAQLGRLRQRRVTQRELGRVKTQLLVELLQDRETIEGIASAIGEAAVVEGDAARVNSSVAALQAVTAADLRRAARCYLIDSRRVTIRFHPTREPIPRRAAAPSPKAPHFASATTTPPPVDQVERQTPAGLPNAGRPADPVAPKVFRRTLADGLRVIVAHTGLQPLATASLTFRGGSALDPPKKSGLASLTAAMAAESAGRRPVKTLVGLADTLSEQLSGATDYDSTSFTLHGLSTSLPQGLKLLVGAVRAQPGEAELRSMRLQISSDLVASLNDEDSISDAAIAPMMFGGGPYGHPPTGYPRTLARIVLADVLRERARLYRPDNAVLVLSGDVEPAAAFALASRLFRNWPRPATPLPRLPTVGRSPLAGRVVAIDVPGMEEAKVMLAGRSIGRLDPSFAATEVANAVLGGGYSSRLNAEIRVRQGLTYGASSDLDGYSGAGLFTASAEVEGRHAAEVAGLMLNQLQGLGRRPPATGEIAARKAELVGRHARETETDDDLADLLTDAALYGGDVGEVARFPATLAAITPRDVHAAAARLADASRVDVLVIGDASRFLPALRARFANVEVSSARSSESDALGGRPPRAGVREGANSPREGLPQPQVSRDVRSIAPARRRRP